MSHPATKEPSHSWADAYAVLHSEEFEQVLRVRLVQLALDKHGSAATSVKAIELLLSMGRQVVEGELSDVPTTILEAADAKLSAWLQPIAISANQPDESSGPDGTTAEGDDRETVLF